MGDQTPPYVVSHSVIVKALEKIKVAATPPRFTQDFLATKLGLSGGSARPIIPFLKRIGFLATDGSPTDLYRRFRNPTESGRAVAQALRIGYRSLYEMNEYAHDLSDSKLKGDVVQATGLEPDSRVVRAIVSSFGVLKKLATFDEDSRDELPPSDSAEPDDVLESSERSLTTSLGLSYTINLNLPATSDIAVFNAIFKSLRDHLLK